MAIRSSILLCLLASLVAISVADVCTFSSYQGNAFAITNYAALAACFQNVPLNAGWKAQTLAQLRNLLSLYSFTDIAKDSGSPYNLQVDLAAGLTTIENTNQASDYEFHRQLNQLFNKLGDAHTLYFPPTPYQYYGIVRPFFLTSIIDVTNTQQVAVSNSVAFNFGGTYASITGIDVSSYVGKTISTINGVSAVQYLTAMGARAGTVKDPSAQFNNALLNSWPSTYLTQSDLPTADDTYTFVGVSGTITLPAIIIGQTYLNTADFMSGLAYSAAKRSDRFAPELPFKQFAYYSYPKNDMVAPLETTSATKSARSTGTLTNVYTAAAPDAYCQRFVDQNGATHSILTMTTFAPSTQTNYNNFVSTIEMCISDAKTNSITSLVVDVRGNGGGYVCLSQDAQYLLVQDWDPTKTGAAATNNLFEPFDSRVNSISTALFTSGWENPTDLMNPAVTPTVAFTSAQTDYFNSPVSHTRGGIEDQYTKKEYFPAECLPEFASISYTSYSFSKILIVTDGLCGSACSQFASKLRYHGKAAVVAVGGLSGQPSEISSFTGGNVLDWQTFVADVATYGSSPVQQLPTSAFTRFNYHEMYMGNEDVPREFQRIPADFKIDNWDYLKASAGGNVATYVDFMNVVVTSFTSGTWGAATTAMGTYYDPNAVPSSAITMTYSLLASVLLALGALL